MKKKHTKRRKRKLPTLLDVARRCDPSGVAYKIIETLADSMVIIESIRWPLPIRTQYSGQLVPPGLVAD